MLGQLRECTVLPQACDRPPKVLQVRLTPEILEQLQKASGDEIMIAFDKALSMRIGQISHSFSMVPEASTIDVFRTSGDSRAPSLTPVGRISHKLTMRRELGSSISDKLKVRQAEEAAAKQERSVQATDIGLKTKKGMPTMLSRSSPSVAARSESPARRSPFLQARKSPLLLASPAKSSQIPLRTRVIQALAIGAATEQEVATRIRVPAEAIVSSLQEVAMRSGTSWVLKDETFQEVKVWDWKGYTSAERVAVISRATEALDRLGLPAKHTARVRLQHPEKRLSDERSDTSPLSLNPPVCAGALNQDLSPPKPKSGVKGPAVPPSTSPLRQETLSTSDKVPEKKVIAKGIMSQGKKPLEKKRKIGSLSDVPDEPQKKRKALGEPVVGSNRPSGTGSEQKAPVKVDQPARVARPAQSEHLEKGNERKRKSDLVTHCPDDEQRLQASRPASGTRQLPSTASPRTESHKVAREARSVSHENVGKQASKSQTPLATTAMVAPSASIQDTHEDDTSVRLASITSSSTDRSERSLKSIASVSTAPSSVSSPPPQMAANKVRSKFLTTKKSMAQKSASPLSAVIVKTKSLAEAKSKLDSPGIPPPAQRKDGAATTVAPKKRKENREAHGTTSRRLQTIDLQNMARDYKQLYPEYQALHEAVSAAVDNQTLLDKFMTLHHKMNTWKQTLIAADKEHERGDH